MRTKRPARIENDQLMVEYCGEQKAIAFTTESYKGGYYWYGLGRSSKKTRPTKDAALKAAAAAMNLKVIP